MAAAPTLCFVGARRGNAFMNELLEAVAHEVWALGMKTEIVLDAFPDLDSRVYVLIRTSTSAACATSTTRRRPSSPGRLRSAPSSRVRIGSSSVSRTPAAQELSWTSKPRRPVS